MADDRFPTRSAIVSNQLIRLRELLRVVIPANQFYTAKLRTAGLTPEIANLGEFSHFPFTTKAELVDDQRVHPPYGTNLTFPLERYTRYHQTSGTTGTPLRWLDTPENWDWMLERWIELFGAAGVSHADRIIFAFSFGPFIGFWLAFDAAAKIGSLCLPSGGLSSLARLRMLLDTEATVLCCTPTYALRLAEVALEEKLDLARGHLRRIVVAGEPGGSIPATRTRLETLWPGARVFDHHGMTETGPVSYECPARPGFLHVMESGFLAEVIDAATGQAAEPGQTGELVLTNLGRTGSPLLRYRTGDLVRAGQSFHRPSDTQSCHCGRHDLVLEGGILGRVDDMVIVRGVNVYPSAVEDVLRACGGVAEYQVKVRRSGPLAELVVMVEPEGAGADVPGLIARIQQGFQNAFALRVSVQAVPSGSLPRFEMKSKRWTVS
jgi:phenylacetate-CoA ligase